MQISVSKSAWWGETEMWLNWCAEWYNVSAAGVYLNSGSGSGSVRPGKCLTSMHLSNSISIIRTAGIESNTNSIANHWPKWICSWNGESNNNNNKVLLPPAGVPILREFFSTPPKKKFSEKNQEDAGTDQCRHGNAPESWLLLTAKYRDGAWWHYVIGQPFRSFSHGIICLLFLTCSSSISLTAARPIGSLWRCTLIESKLNVEIIFLKLSDFL